MKQEIYQYTVMPTHMRDLFTTEELAATTLAKPFPFSKGVPLMKVPVIERSPLNKYMGPAAMIENDTRLYDLVADPGQQSPLKDAALEARMIALMRRHMAATEAPPEAYKRLELEPASGS
jgi:hypothetical protein